MSRPDMTEKEKAESFLSEYLAEIQRGNRYASDLSGWLVESLTPDALAGLARDWDDSQADRPADVSPWVVKLDDLGEPDAGPADYWSNSDGWTRYIELADRFTDAEKQTFNLPAGGVWVRMEGEPG